MKRLIIIAAALCALTACSGRWVPLFDGKSLEGWTDTAGQDMPANYWSVVDGVIVSHPDLDDLPDDVKKTLATSAGSRDLMSTGSYKNFRLKFSFRLEEGSNGGIKYFINPGKLSSPSIGFEYQLIDDLKFRDMSDYPLNNVQTTASLYDILSANKKDADFRIYEWNEGMIVVKDGIVQHWLNGVKVLEIDRYSTSFDLLVNNSKFRKEEGFGKFPEGHIILQDHGCKVFYRDIMIQEIK